MANWCNWCSCSCSQSVGRFLAYLTDLVRKSCLPAAQFRPKAEIWASVDLELLPCRLWRFLWRRWRRPCFQCSMTELLEVGILILTSSHIKYCHFSCPLLLPAFIYSVQWAILRRIAHWPAGRSSSGVNLVQRSGRRWIGKPWALNYLKFLPNCNCRLSVLF